jgi:hypothetical protein
VTSIQENFGTGLYYNPFVEINGMVCVFVSTIFKTLLLAIEIVSLIFSYVLDSQIWRHEHGAFAGRHAKLGDTLRCWTYAQACELIHRYFF